MRNVSTVPEHIEIVTVVLLLSRINVCIKHFLTNALIQIALHSLRVKNTSRHSQSFYGNHMVKSNDDVLSHRAVLFPLCAGSVRVPVSGVASRVAWVAGVMKDSHSDRAAADVPAVTPLAKGKPLHSGVVSIAGDG